MINALLYIMIGVGIDRFLLRPSVFNILKKRLAVWLRNILEEDEVKEEKEKTEEKTE